MSRQRPTTRTSSRGAAARLVVGIAIGAGLIYGGDRWRNQELQLKQAADAQLADAQQRASTAIADRADLAAYKASYEQLKQNHVLGQEDRLPWAEYFNQIVKQADDPAFFRLAIEPQRLFEMPPKQPLGDLKLFASRAKAEAGLLHEGSLYRLLASLNKVAGAHIVHSCELARPDGADVTQGNLKAVCELDLLTLSKPPEPADRKSVV